MINSLKYTVFTPRVSKLAKFSHFAEKIVFWSTLEDPSEKAVHLEELVTIFKVVEYNIVDIIRFDKKHCPVKCGRTV